MSAGRTVLVQLPEDVRGLLAAVLEAIDLPLPAIDDADERAHNGLLTVRAGRAAIALRSALGEPEDLAGAAQWLRDRIAEDPITYTPWKRADKASAGAEQ